MVLNIKQVLITGSQNVVGNDCMEVQRYAQALGMRLQSRFLLYIIEVQDQEK